MSHDAYRQAAQRAEGPRQSEYKAFCEATARLIKAREDAREDLSVLIDAIHFNRNLWGVLAADCKSDENLLPAETRGAIISLSAWVSKHSSGVMREKQSLDPLIDINRMMIDGLSGKSPEAADAAL